MINFALGFLTCFSIVAVIVALWIFLPTGEPEGDL
jgi:hypothetical protein